MKIGLITRTQYGTNGTGFWRVLLGLYDKKICFFMDLPLGPIAN